MPVYATPHMVVMVYVERQFINSVTCFVQPQQIFLRNIYVSFNWNNYNKMFISVRKLIIVCSCWNTNNFSYWRDFVYQKYDFVLFWALVNLSLGGRCSLIMFIRSHNCFLTTNWALTYWSIRSFVKLNDSDWVIVDLFCTQFPKCINENTVRVEYIEYQIHQFFKCYRNWTIAAVVREQFCNLQM